MGLYKLWHDDIELLEHVEKVLRDQEEESLANDIILLKSRLEYLYCGIDRLWYVRAVDRNYKTIEEAYFKDQKEARAFMDKVTR